MEPQPLEPWDGVWNATKISSWCMHIDHVQSVYPILGEEDCLYLNIYTPKLPVNGGNPLLDVMVYIHGGGFTFSTGSIHLPHHILQKDDIVFININYRLGSLGFFSTGDNTAPGNFGLKDQVAALKWVQRNIINFGGNPASVTIVGCSAGGASVHYHFLSPLSDEFIPHDNMLKELNDKWNEIAPNLLMYNYTVPEHEKNAVSDAIKNFYFGDNPISKGNIKELIRLVGDRLFYNEIFDITKLHNLVTKSNVYCYKFSYRGKQSLSNVFSKNFEDYGVSHGDDESYLLNYLFEISSSDETEADKEMTKFISSIFINFMKTGNPALGIDIWKPLTKNQDPTLTCLNISSPTDLEFKDISNLSTSEFWKNHSYFSRVRNGVGTLKFKFNKLK